MFKKILLVAALTSASVTTFAAADAGLSFSGSAALTSDYRFRGMTQTETDPALQGGFALSHSSGVYAGVWGSNVNFGSADPHLELDPYIGYTTDLSFAALDVGLWYYGYPSASDLNWLELYAKLGFDDVVATGDNLLASVNYTNDWGGADVDGWYLNLAYSVAFADTGFGGVASLGYTTVDDVTFGSGSDDNYIDWKVGVTYAVPSIEGFTAELAAIGTNIDTDGLAKSTKRGVETGAVFTLTKTF